ncbi:MAG: YdcF family protein [Candidatus Methanomethyliaceae archaeon]
MLGGVLDLPRSEPERLEFEASADRFVQALHLARRFPNALLVFSGGSSDLFDQTKREASFLKAEAMAWGIPEKQIYVEDRARNTYENAVEAKRILEERGGGHLVAVTTACHLRRALGCMRKVGIEAIPYPVDFRSHPRYWRPFDIIPQVEELESSTLAIREYVGILMYRLQGYL